MSITSNLQCLIAKDTARLAECENITAQVVEVLSTLALKPIDDTLQSGIRYWLLNLGYTSVTFKYTYRGLMLFCNRNGYTVSIPTISPKEFNITHVDYFKASSSN